jgi:predicted nucleic acid-binding protein
MRPCLVDTSVILRVVNERDAQHDVAARAIESLAALDQYAVLTPQVLIEFWAVATRPVENNGLGWHVKRAKAEVDHLLGSMRLPLLSDSAAIFQHWRDLVERYSVSGKQVHDARIVVVMLAHGVTHLVTLNIEDFRRYREITVVQPL